MNPKNSIKAPKTEHGHGPVIKTVNILPVERDLITPIPDADGKHI